MQHSVSDPADIIQQYPYISTSHVLYIYVYTLILVIYACYIQFLSCDGVRLHAQPSS